MKMKLILLFILFAGLASAQDMTFSQAAEEMFRQNPVLAQRKLESEASRDQWDRSQATYWPQLDFSQTWSRSNNPVYVFGTLLNQQNFTAANFALDSLNHPDPLTDFSSRFDVGWL